MQYYFLPLVIIVAAFFFGVMLASTPFDPRLVGRGVILSITAMVFLPVGGYLGLIGARLDPFALSDYVLAIGVLSFVLYLVTMLITAFMDDVKRSHLGKRVYDSLMVSAVAEIYITYSTIIFGLCLLIHWMVTT